MLRRKFFTTFAPSAATSRSMFPRNAAFAESRVKSSSNTDFYGREIFSEEKVLPVYETVYNKDKCQP